MKTVRFYRAGYESYNYMGWLKLTDSVYHNDILNWLRSDKENHFVEIGNDQFNFYNAWEIDLSGCA